MSIIEQVKEFSTKQSNGKSEKISVLSAEIVVHGSIEKPYYEIEYYDLSDRKYHTGYSSYDLNNVFRWKEECFEIVKEDECDMVSEQVKELRKTSDGIDTYSDMSEYCGLDIAVMLNEAADTIESLSAKLQAANKEIEALNIIKEIGDEVTANLR